MRLPISPAMSWEHFVFEPSNRPLRAILERVGAATDLAGQNPIFLFGGLATGKTHLLHAMAQRQKSALLLDLDAYIHGLADGWDRSDDPVILVDDVHRLEATPTRQAELFVGLEWHVRRGHLVVLTANRYMRDLKLVDAAFAFLSRGLALNVQPLDREQMAHLLVRHAGRQGADIAHSVALELVRLVRGNMHEHLAILSQLIAEGRQTIASTDLTGLRHSHGVADLFKDPRVDVDRILRHMVEEYKVNISDLKGPSRVRRLVLIRQIACYLLRKGTSLSLPEIGRVMGNRDHTTVIHSIRVVQGLPAKNSKAWNRVQRLAKELGIDLNVAA